SQLLNFSVCAAAFARRLKRERNAKLAPNWHPTLLARQGLLARLKLNIDRDPTTGKHRIRYVTVRGTKAAAQAELARLRLVILPLIWICLSCFGLSRDRGRLTSVFR